MSFLQAIGGQYRVPDFFSEKNIDFLQKKITEILKREFSQDIIIPKESILQICQRVVEERLERTARLNQRVVMYLTNEYRNHYLETQKRLKWEENFTKAVSLFDEENNRGPFLDIKPNQRLKEPRVGGTLRFYFTY